MSKICVVLSAHRYRCSCYLHGPGFRDCGGGLTGKGLGIVQVFAASCPCPLVPSPIPAHCTFHLMQVAMCLRANGLSYSRYQGGFASSPKLDVDEIKAYLEPRCQVRPFGGVLFTSNTKYQYTKYDIYDTRYWYMIRAVGALVSENITGTW